MAEKTFELKLQIDPFQEVRRDRKKYQKYEELGIRLPGGLKYGGKIVPGSSRWDKRRAEEAIRAFFRYDLQLFATQLWRAYEPIEKARNGQDRQKRIKAFGTELKRNLSALDKTLARKFAEAQEDIAEGASDDADVLRGLRKSAQGSETGAMLTVLKDFHGLASSEMKRLEKEKRSGNGKGGGTDTLTKDAAALAARLQRESADVERVNRIAVKDLTKLIETMTRGAKKDVSEGTALTLKRSQAAVKSALAALTGELKKANAGREKAIAKVRRGDFGPGVLDLVPKPGGSLARELLKADRMISELAKELTKLEKSSRKS